VILFRDSPRKHERGPVTIHLGTTAALHAPWRHCGGSSKRGAWLLEWFTGAVGNVGREDIRRAAHAFSCALNCAAQCDDFLCAPGASASRNGVNVWPTPCSSAGPRQQSRAQREARPKCHHHRCHWQSDRDGALKHEKDGRR
jgi:hypothetical protein